MKTGVTQEPSVQIPKAFCQHEIAEKTEMIQVQML